MDICCTQYISWPKVENCTQEGVTCTGFPSKLRSLSRKRSWMCLHSWISLIWNKIRNSCSGVSVQKVYLNFTKIRNLCILDLVYSFFCVKLLMLRYSSSVLVSRPVPRPLFEGVSLVWETSPFFLGAEIHSDLECISRPIKNTMAGDITVLNTSLLRKESPRKHLYKVILRLVNGKHGVYLSIWQ